MVLIKPNTFVAGTKAKATEVNENFDSLYAQVNTDMTNIITIQDDIDNLTDTKAELNGNNTERFLMAEPVNNYDGVNKLFLSKYTTNSQSLLTGLYVSKSTDDTILVSAGACFDSTLAKQLKLDSDTSKQNTTQSASTTYYVYIIAKASSTIFGSEIDLLISTSSSNPPLPTDYVFYRLIGEYTTDSSNKIYSTSSVNPVSYSEDDIINASMVDYENITTGTVNTTYQASTNGDLIVYGTQTTTTRYVSIGSTNTLDGNGNLSIILYVGVSNSGTISTLSSTFKIPKGYYYRTSIDGAVLKFVPTKGV